MYDPKIILDHLPVTIYAKDTESRFTYVNQAFVAYVGRNSPEEVIGLADSDIFTSPHAEEARRDELKVMETGIPLIDREELETWPDGRRTWVLTSKLALRDAAGQVVGTFGISKDISTTKEELERYRLAVEAAQNGLWHRNFRTKTLWFSPRWKEILGYRDDEMANEIKEWKDRVHPDDYERVESAFGEHCVGHTPTFECDFRMKHKDGSYLWIRARGKATRNANGKLEAFAGSRTDITAIKDREGFYERVLAVIPSLVFVKDRSLKFTYINDAVAKAIGLPKDQILGQTDSGINPDKVQVAHFEEDDRKVLESVTELEITKEQLTDAKGKSVRTLASKKVRLDAPSGSPDARQVLGVAADITALQQAKDDLEYERELLHSLMNNVPDGISFKDRQGRFIRVNQALAELAGLDRPEQLVGRADVEVFGDDYARVARKEERGICETGESIQNIVHAIPTAKGVRWRLVSKAPIRDKSGEIVQFVTVGKDITELKTAQDALRRQTELMERVLHHMPQAIFVKDRDGVYEMCNRSFALRRGHQETSKVVGSTDFDHWDQDVANKYRGDDQSVMDKDESKVGFREEQPRPDGRIATLETSKFPLHDENGNVVAVLGIFEDITDRLDAETRQLQAQKRRLHDDITRSIGHCLKNRVSTLEACRFSLELAFGKSETLNQMKETIGSFKHALRIALSFERLDAGMNHELLSVDVILKKLVQELQDQRIHLGKLSQVLVRGDGFHLENALLELLHNALDFTKKSDSDGWVKVWIDVKDGLCPINFEDNGSGIPEHLKERLFDRFSRENPSRTGMGLAYVRRVAKEHAGTVELVDKPPPGAHFVLTLPIHNAEEDCA